MESEISPHLAPLLEQTLQQLTDPTFSGRLRKVYVAGARAISRLSDLDLVRYETRIEETGADLSLWEEMAPVIRDTVLDVNALLHVMREQFPPGEPRLGSHPQAATATAVIQESVLQMASGVTQLGEAMRNPAVMGDRWNLLAEVQSFRTRFRSQVGSMIYESITSFADLHRKDVVPGHDGELRAALALRSTLADLLRVISGRLDKVREAEPEDVQWNAQQLQGELDTFGKTAAYKALRAQDKRRLVEQRSVVGRLVTSPTPSRAELLMVCQELRDFVAGLGEVSQRAILQQHDRELMAGCGVRLEQAAQLMRSQPEAAAHAFVEAAAGAQALYGRVPELDLFLRRTRKLQACSLSLTELRTSVETLRQLLSGLPLK